MHAGVPRASGKEAGTNAGLLILWCGRFYRAVDGFGRIFFGVLDRGFGECWRVFVLCSLHHTGGGGLLPRPAPICRMVLKYYIVIYFGP